MLKNIFWMITSSSLLLPFWSIKTVFAQSGGSVTPQPLGRLQSPLKDVGGINGLIAALLEVVVFVLAPIAVLFIMYAGFKYVTARGDASKVQEATKALTWAVVGTAVLIGASVISGIIEGTIEEVLR